MAINSLSSVEAVSASQERFTQKEKRTCSPVDDTMVGAENKFKQLGNRPGDNTLKQKWTMAAEMG